MIRPDKTQFLSELPQYLELPPVTGSLVVSGVFPSGFSQNFTANVAIQSNATRVDLYGTNQNTQKKQLLSSTGFPAIYQNAGGELAQHTIIYGVGLITWQLLITNNTASTITLINQTFALKAVCYTLPI